MWILSWKRYKLSKFATFVSIIGALMRYAAVICVVNGLVPAFLICAAIGIGLHFGAQAISTKKWQKTVIDQGYTSRIAAGDVQAAIAVYNANPSESTLNFIASYNPQIAQHIRAQVKK